ncbi:MAG TPA: ABC transporter substrate-binding protein [Burkholderiaceae bacterium]|nr:ABC transporter substrate-binding protein [Burkholderiaceae bacterium]
MKRLSTARSTRGVVGGLLIACAAGAGQTQVLDRVIDRATISLPAPTQSLDPTASVSATDRAVFTAINGTLMRTEIDGSIVPGLAESIRYSPDFRTATVELRRNLKFSDGSPLTARDVAGTFNRHMKVERSVMGAMMGRIASVEPKGDLTVEFKFKNPFPSFGQFSATGSYGIYPAQRIGEAEFFKSPVTAGKYRIVSGWAGNKIQMTANEHYYGPRPVIKDLTFAIVEDANSAISQLQGGTLDFAGDLPPTYLTQLKSVQGITVSAVPTYGFYDLRLHNRSGPFADVNVRKAASLALDRQAIVRAIWNDTNKPQSGYWPVTTPWHDPSLKTTADIEGARALLSKTACASSCEVRMIYSDQDFAFASQLALMVQNQLQKAGFKVQLQRLDTPTLVKRLFAGDYDMAPGAMASSADIPDPLLTLSLLSTGPLKAEFTGYNSPQMDALVTKVQESSGEVRTTAARDLAKLFAEDMPYLVYATWVRGAASRLPAGAVSVVGTGVVVGHLKQ